MRRLLNTWPYIVGVVGLFGLLWAFELAPTGGWGMDDMDLTGLHITVRYVAFPALAFLGAALLGLRRGYDPMVLVVCLLVAVAIPEPLFHRGQLELSWDHSDELFHPRLSGGHPSRGGGRDHGAAGTATRPRRTSAAGDPRHGLEEPPRGGMTTVSSCRVMTVDRSSASRPDGSTPITPPALATEWNPCCRKVGSASCDR